MGGTKCCGMTVSGQIGSVQAAPAPDLPQMPGYAEAAGRSALAVDRHGKGGAHLPHPLAAQAPESLDQHRHRGALDRVEIDSRKSGNGVPARFEEDLARKVPDGGCAGSDHGAAQSGDSGVSG